MSIIEVSSLAQPELAVYGSLTDAQLRLRQDSEHAILIAESPKVIRVALNAGCQPISMLCERKHIAGDAADIIAQCPDVPVYTGDRDLLCQLTGYKLTRGVLCAMHRPDLPKVEEIVKNATRLVVIDGVVDTTNIGAIFRSAAALGIDSVLLTPNSCDPFNRRAIRVSMGTVFLMPWTWLHEPISSLKDFGFTTVAMALREDALSMDDPRLASIDRMAIIMGTEGDGLPSQEIAQADYVVRIPMSRGVDSLNVAAASAVAFWELRDKRNRR